MPAQHPFCPATYFSGAITCFTIANKLSFIKVPFTLSNPVFSPDGRNVYSEAGLLTDKLGVFAIRFNPTRAVLLAGTEGLSLEGKPGISADGKMLFFYAYSKRSLGEPARIFEFDFKTNLLVDRGPLRGDPGNSSRILALSPDGSKVAAVGDKGLQIVDANSGSLKVLERAVVSASWSPNGRWILATDPARTGSVVLNADDFTVRRRLPGADGAWSPDSRLILSWSERALCMSLFGSLRIFDLESGRSAFVKSSRCRVLGGTCGWLDEEVARASGISLLAGISAS